MPASSSSTDARGDTGGDGRYTMRDVPAGVVEVRVLRVGYQEQKKSVTVTSGASATLDFTLTSDRSAPGSRDHRDRRAAPRGARAQRHDDQRHRQEGRRAAHQFGERPAHRARPRRERAGPGRDRFGAGHPHSRSQLVELSATRRSYSSTASASFSSTFSAPSNGGTTFSFLNNFSPEEIEDIEIVKGPSAATLYGTDAANGVIVITTKKGTRRQRALDLDRRGRRGERPQ